MDIELPHFLFRWLHVLSAVMRVGQIWSLAVVLPFPPNRPADPSVAPMILRAHNRIMTGRAMFIHIGAMLATIMLVNVEQRIWPVERRRLAVTSVKEPPSMQASQTAAVRLHHNAALAVAVTMFMLSNHFPLVYGSSYNWLIAPGIILTAG